MIMAVALLVSCSEQSTGNVPVMTLDHTVKDTANTLISENLNFNIPISAQEIYICEDSIAVVCNKNSTWFLELYNLNENRLIKHLLRHGNGPGEMLDVNFYFNNDTIGIEDFQKDRIAIIPIHDAVYNDSYNPELRTLSLQSQYKLPFKGRLIALTCMKTPQVTNMIHSTSLILLFLFLTSMTELYSSILISPNWRFMTFDSIH